jgi:hypothetical protein
MKILSQTLLNSKEGMVVIPLLWWQKDAQPSVLSRRLLVYHQMSSAWERRKFSSGQAALLG